VLEVDIMDKDKASRDEFLGRAKYSLTSHLPQTLSSNSSTKLISASLPLQSAVGKRTKYPKLSGQVELQLVWRPLLPTPPSASVKRASSTSSFSSSSSSSSIPSAILTIFLYSANNLNWFSKPEAAVPTAHQPVPRASLVVGATVRSVFQPDGEVQTTNSVRRSRQVDLNQGFTFLLGVDWRSKSVQITVDDSSQGGKSFGSLVMGMRELTGSDLERASKSLLTNYPEQTITLSAYLRFPAPSADVVV